MISATLVAALALGWIVQGVAWYFAQRAADRWETLYREERFLRSL